MINKITIVITRIIFIYFLGLNAVAYGVQVAAGNNAPHGARDNELNVADLLLQERFVLGLETPTPEELKVGDVAPLVNGVPQPNGIIDIADLLVLQRAVLGLITLQPIDLNSVSPPSALTYSSNPAIYTLGISIASNTPSSSGGAVVSYSISPALPVGLSLNITTGVISGTPGSVASTASYTVSASNSGGSSSTVLLITVNNVKPSALIYSVNPAIYSLGTAIAPNIPSSSGGAVVSYSVSPALLSGLSLNTTTGVISGTPTAVTGSTSYTVTATNSGGSTTATVTITVNNVKPSALIYSANPAVYTVGTAIVSNTPSSSGGAVVSYSISPALPAGLSLSTTTGVICGTPTVITSSASYTVTATNNLGSAAASVSITINNVKPSALTYSVNPAVYIVGTAITSNTPSSSGGAVVSYSVSPTLPAGLSLGTTTGVISGTPTTVTGSTSYTVTATNSGGSTTAAVLILVNSSTPPGTFTVTANLNTAREWHTATALANGKVLIVGGDNNVVSAIASAELYDPATGTFTATGSLITARVWHAATLLTNGKVLITGGVDTNGNALKSAELYDPSTNNFTATGNLITLRNWHTATLLTTGKVLIAGGDDNLGNALKSAEVYDPGTAKFTATTNLMITARTGHVATRLANGQVLVAGGYDTNFINALASAELYDPGTNKFTATTNLITARANTTATLLANGKVLIAGGYDSNSNVLVSAELYNATTGTFTATANLNNARTNATATLLANGKVLIAGGADDTGSGIVNTELYDPATGQFTWDGNLITPRELCTATLLASGQVLLAGGYDYGQYLANAELYNVLVFTPPSALTYSANPAVYTTYAVIPPNTPSNSGGTVAVYSVVPALPAGLTLDSTTGIISGTPSTATAISTYTITATNAWGSTSASLTMTVNALVAPTLNAIAASTTTNPYIISGTAMSNITVRLYVNNLLQASKTSAANGAFTFETALNDGFNSIYTTTSVGTHESAHSITLGTTYTNTLSRTQSGSISANTVWTPGVPVQPYVITSSNLTISSSATLQIQPGTVIQFSSGGTLTVNGALQVNGTSISPVMFTSNAATIAGSWTGITIADTATNVVINNAKIMYASTGITINSSSVLVENSTLQNNTTGITVANASPTITGNTITANQDGLTLIGGASPQVSGNIITANTRYGIYMTGTSPAGPNPQPVVQGNQILSNTFYNVYALSYYYSGTVPPVVIMTGNWWGTTDAGVIAGKIADYSDSAANAPVVNYSGYLNAANGTAVTGNPLIGPIAATRTLTAGTYQVLGSVLVASGATLTIPEGTTLQFVSGTGLTVNGGLVVNGTSASPVVFTSNAAQPKAGDWAGIAIYNHGALTETNWVINHAQIAYALNGIRVIRNSLVSGYSSMLIENCTFQNNVTGISLTLGVSPTLNGNTITSNTYGINLTDNANPLVTNNIIANNSWGIYLDVTSGNLILPNPVVNGNQIYSNTNFNVSAFTNYYRVAVPTVVNMTGNWWGTTDAGAIAAKIYDYSDTPSYYSQLVNFSGYDLDAAGVTKDPRQLLTPIIAPTQNVSIAAGNYLVLSSIQIPAGISLTINPGANLFFLPVAGIDIYGSLQVNGQLNNMVTLTSASQGVVGTSYLNWGGITINQNTAAAVISYANIYFAYRGVYFDNVSGTIQHSNLLDNTVAIYLKGNSNVTIDSNVIAGNATGIYLDGDITDPLPVISNNDIYANNNQSLYLYRIEATTVLNNSGNWWGSSDLATIRASFFLRESASLITSVPLTNIATQAHTGLTTISLTAPVNGAVYYAPAVVPLAVNVSTNIAGRTITRVSYFNGATLLGESTASPFSYSLTNVAAGTYTITAVATDNIGLTIASVPVSITVSPVITISLTSPGNGTVYYAPATVPLIVNVSTTVPGRTIAKVGYYNGGTLLAESTVSPFSYTLTNVAAGTYLITAVATDSTGATATSTAISTTVINLTTISLTAPGNNSVFNAPALIPLAVNVNTSIPGRSIAKVGYYNGGTLLGESIVSPFSYTLTNIAAGNYSITAVATDNTNATTTSTPVSITVNPTTLSFDASIAGSTVNDDHMLVFGTFNAPPNTGVTINGVLATVVPNGASYLFYANNVPLSPGVNTLQANLVSQDGQTAAPSVTVNSTGSPGFSVVAEEVTGVSPVTITFNYKNTTAQVVGAIQVSVNGTQWYPLENPSDTLTFNYALTNDNYVFTFTVLDTSTPANVLYTTKQEIFITTNEAQDALIKPVITGMLSRLSQGNITAALTSFAPGVQDRYNTIFTTIGSSLPTAVNTMGTLQSGTFNDHTAEYSLSRNTQTGMKAFFIDLMLGTDGVWRIDSM